MTTKVQIYVEEDYVGDMIIKDNPRQYWQNFIDAAGQSPLLVQIDKTANQIPSEGMLYVENEFLPSADSLSMPINNNIGFDFERFALIVNGTYMASHDVSKSTMPHVIAAYQSGSTFTVVTE